MQRLRNRPRLLRNRARNYIRMPGQLNSDISLAKSFSIWEKSGFQFRFDAFNAFNHWNPDSPEIPV